METLIKDLRQKIKTCLVRRDDNSQEIHYLTLALAQLELIRKNKIYANADKIESKLLDGMMDFRCDDVIINTKVQELFMELQSLFNDLMTGK